MKHYINGTEITCQEMVDKLVLLADQSAVSSHLLQWTIQVNMAIAWHKSQDSVSLGNML